LKAGLGGDIIRIKTKTPDADRMISKFDFVQKIERADGFLVLSVNNAKRALPVLLQAIEAESAEFASPTLNDVFIQLTGRNIKEQAEGGFMERYAKYD
jgi:ABC-2 type transport system ATP-binding protein